MTEEPSQTPLDIAHAAMVADPENDAARLRYYSRLADGMLFLMLDAEVEAGAIRPSIFQLEDGPVVLAFDLEERLAAASGGAVAYAELPGRVIAAELAGQGVALGVNLGVAESAYLIPPEALTWLAQTLERAPDEVNAIPKSFHSPTDLPKNLLDAIDTKLARASGLADAAFLAGVTYTDGRRGHILAFVGARIGADAALARAIGEALTFSGIDVGELDVVFLAAQDNSLAGLARVGLRFDLPEPVAQAMVTPQAPGSDPERPPILR